jgi:glutathione-specific gamma-glutamylcyclotransferase
MLPQPIGGPGGVSISLFAYGSLIWKPEIEHVEERAGSVRGWHRSFCLRQTRWRGTKEQPGLMMALDRGGQCRGVLYRLPDTDLEGQLGKLFRREFTLKPPNNIPLRGI